MIEKKTKVQVNGKECVKGAYEEISVDSFVESKELCEILINSGILPNHKYKSFSIDCSIDSVPTITAEFYIDK